MIFENIQDYYNFIESDSGLLNIDRKLSLSISSLRDKIDNEDLKFQCSQEIFFTDFIIEKGEIKSHPRVDGNEYPNFALFNDDFKYIKIRAVDVKNAKYKAKYNHILWESKHKHLDFGKQAVDNYFAFLENTLFPLPDNLVNHAFENCFQTLFILSQNTSYKKDEVIQFLISILGSNKIIGYKEYSLMKFIADEGKKIDRKYFQVFYDYSNKILGNNIYPIHTKEYLELLIILSIKINTSPIQYHNKLADLIIEESKLQKESFINQDSYLEALRQYQKAGNKEKIEEVSVLIEKGKKHVDFKSVKWEYTDEKLQQWWENLKTGTDTIIETYTSQEIFNYLILSPIFPKASVLNTEVRPATFDFVSVRNFDINKNIVDKAKSGIHPYFIHIENFSLKHLWLIFSKGIKADKISYETLIEFLKNNTWYGMDFTSANADGKVVGFDWIKLLSPSLLSFFSQSEIDIKLHKDNNEEYILAIDSIVLKFEGLLREFSRTIGAQTIDLKSNSTQERISIEKLLDNPKIIELIPEDDIALFKFLFTSEGMDLRNNIAHCFYKADNYSAGLMFLIITALLRLGNYKLENE
jgi:hypothetical protein